MTDRTARHPSFWAKVWQLQETGECPCTSAEEMLDIQKAQESVQRAQCQLVRRTGQHAAHAAQVMRAHAAARRDSHGAEVKEAMYTPFCEKDDVEVFQSMDSEVNKWAKLMAPLEAADAPAYVPPVDPAAARERIKPKWEHGGAPARTDAKLDFFVSLFCTPVPARGVPPRQSPVPQWQESPPPTGTRRIA